MLLREELEKREFEILSEKAAKSAESKGRMFPEEKCNIRTDFQRDRDRIIHSKAFRRLMHKTQVFLAPEGDHFRTRLTHTIEVSQIARTIARALNLNEDLTEAIALGHDLGHTPFGHNGEEVLNKIHPGGFEHNVQSLRVADVIESTQSRRGMNLTMEVRDGIVNHTGPVRISIMILTTPFEAALFLQRICRKKPFAFSAAHTACASTIWLWMSSQTATAGTLYAKARNTKPIWMPFEPLCLRMFTKAAG